MMYFIAFISVGILLGLYVIRVITSKEKRKKADKDKLWDQQLNDLLETFKKKKK